MSSNPVSSEILDGNEVKIMLGWIPAPILVNLIRKGGQLRQTNGTNQKPLKKSEFDLYSLRPITH